MDMCEAKKEIEAINKECAKRGTDLALMKKDIEDIKDKTNVISILREGMNKLLGHFEEDGIVHTIKQDTTRHNGRLTKLEAKYWVATGMIIVMGWVVGYGMLELRHWSNKIESNEHKILKIDNYFEVE